MIQVITQSYLNDSALEALAFKLRLLKSKIVACDLGSSSIRLASFWRGRADGNLNAMMIPHTEHWTVLESVRRYVGTSSPDLFVLVSTGCVENGRVTPTNGLTEALREADLADAANGANVIILNDAEGAAYQTLWMPWEGNVQPIWPHPASRPDPQGDMLHVVVGGGLGACRRAAGSSRVVATEMGHPQPLSNHHPDDAIIHELVQRAGLRPSCELAGAGAIGLSTAYAALSGKLTYHPQVDFRSASVPDIYRLARQGDLIALRAVAKQARELGAWLGTQALAHFAGGIVIDSDAVLAQLDLLVESGLIEAIEAAVGEYGSNSRQMAMRTPIGVITSTMEMGLLGGARYGLLHLAGQI